MGKEKIVNENITHDRKKEEKVGEHKGKEANGEMGKVNSHEAFSSGPDT